MSMQSDSENKFLIEIDALMQKNQRLKSRALPEDFDLKRYTITEMWGEWVGESEVWYVKVLALDTGNCTLGRGESFHDAVQAALLKQPSVPYGKSCGDDVQKLAGFLSEIEENTINEMNENGVLWSLANTETKIHMLFEHVLFLARNPSAIRKGRGEVV